MGDGRAWQRRQARVVQDPFASPTTKGGRAEEVVILDFPSVDSSLRRYTGRGDVWCGLK